VDAVTSLGGIPVKADAWQIDALYSGTQKCLSCPPGLAPVTFSDRAVDKILKRKTKVPNWYLDLSMLINYWSGDQRTYHHTAPINMLYGLYQALHGILTEGLDTVFMRHRQSHLALVSGLEAMGMEMLVAGAHRLPMLNAVRIPKGVDDVSVRQKLLKDHRIEIGAGLGPLAGKIWRIGVMGHTARMENIDRLLEALKSVTGL
jgi:alanine-glyoxylate transaminase/serine-glyoxylate transaminase/serine-pyruvate transaminase